MIHLLDFPYNGETPRSELIRSKITNNEWHLCVSVVQVLPWMLPDSPLRSVRNHGGIPDLDEDAFELEIGGLVSTPTKISMKDLKDPTKFPSAKLPSHSPTFSPADPLAMR